MKLFIILIITVVSIVSLSIGVCYYIISNYKKKPFEYSKINDPYTKPYIIKDLLTNDDCNMIINLAKDHLFDSEVLGGKHTQIRNSKQAWLSKGDEHIKNIINKICHKVNMSCDNAEDLQVVRYNPGQYYNEHHDSCCDKNESCENFIK